MALPQSTAEIEALAAMKALKFSQDLGNLEVVLEGDLGHIWYTILDIVMEYMRIII